MYARVATTQHVYVTFIRLLYVTFTSLCVFQISSCGTTRSREIDTIICDTIRFASRVNGLTGKRHYSINELIEEFYETIRGLSLFWGDISGLSRSFFFSNARPPTYISISRVKSRKIES